MGDWSVPERSPDGRDPESKDRHRSVYFRWGSRVDTLSLWGTSRVRTTSPRVTPQAPLSRVGGPSVWT